ncbi:chlorophyll a/b-binding protein [Synechococcus sp. M16CYN]|uniref:chlorophyll a/b-binding protein n=1 Tax=Synechococcus sp. M16CYN TaxID=3103139 RepID=UPI003341D813
MTEQPVSRTAVRQAPEPVGSSELNAWKRGFTPQAEIWNGRLAMIGLSAGLVVLLVSRVCNTG